MSDDKRLSNAINKAVVRGVKLTLVVSLCRFLIRFVLAIKGLVVMAMFWRIHQLQAEGIIPIDHIVYLPYLAAGYYFLVCLFLVIAGGRNRNDYPSDYLLFLASCLLWPMWAIYAGLSFGLKFFDWIRFLDAIEEGNND